MTRPAARAIAAAAADLQAWLPAGLVPVSGRALNCGEDRPLRALLNPQTLDLVAREPVVPGAGGRHVGRAGRDGGADGRRPDLGLPRARGRRRTGLPRASTSSAARPLTIDEIIARHQAAAARQAAEIVTSIATGSLTLTFEAPGFVAPITITSQTTISDGPGPGPTVAARRDIRVNGVRFTARDGVPRLPIIEPERAAAPPLAITLSDVYRYRLVGREPIGGRDCYVVAFAPRDRARAAVTKGARGSTPRRSGWCGCPRRRPG